MKDDKSLEDLDLLPDHESGVRRAVSDARGLLYQPLRSMAEARSFSDGVVILEGDDGGQIYVVCPASIVKCAEESLSELLRDLDEIAWPGNDPDMARVFYERRAVGSGVTGGMGGAVVREGIWIHDEFIKLRLGDAIREVIEGKRHRIKEVA